MFTSGPSRIRPLSHPPLAMLLMTLGAWPVAFVVVLALLTLLGDELKSLPLAVRALVISGVVVSLMANLVMPVLNLAIMRWLSGGPMSGRSRERPSLALPTSSPSPPVTDWRRKGTQPAAVASATLERVNSSDGTPIAFWRSGSGPPLVLVHGTTGAHWSFAFLSPVLAERFTLYALDRRGRGESGDADAYAIELEFEDVAAVADSLGEPATLFGHSYGATVALGAALIARNLRQLILYEPAPGSPSVPNRHVERIEELVAADEREEALLYALRSFGLTPAELDQSRAAPTWSARVAAAHTIAREIRAEEAYSIDPDRSRCIAAPTLLLVGEESPGWAQEGTKRVSAALPDARIAPLHGQGHAAIMTAPALVAEEIARFLSEKREIATDTGGRHDPAGADSRS